MRSEYNHTELVHNFSAPTEVVPLVVDLVKPSSVLDVGCGTGTWLKIFERLGVTDYLGVDGTYLDKKLLKIPEERFFAFDLSEKLHLGRKFDLVLSLEVAEHLHESVSDQFIDTLVSHSDTILFSAAIPGQGGQNHVNEQWQTYWQEKFAARGYFFHDVIRPAIWNNPEVNWWYKQNIFLVKKGIHADSCMTNVVHPELFAERENWKSRYIESLNSGREGLRIGSQIFINTLMFKLKKLIAGNRL